MIIIEVARTKIIVEMRLIMGKIVAIGGGENGHHKTKYETAEFDKEIIALTGKTKPNFLFVGLANKYPDYYFEVMNGIYRKMYHCNTEYLKYEDIFSEDVTYNKIKNADIIYVGGGNTYKLMTLFRRYKIDTMLSEAYNSNKVLCGVSAGAICWCDYGNSDSRKISSASDKLIRVSGLGFIPVLFCPHYNKEPFRQDDLMTMMKRTYRIPAIALDNAALEVVDNKFRIIKLSSGAVAKKCFWKKNEYHQEDINADCFIDLSTLIYK